eukprot:998335-Lingulodinium_polyedra.AAC.1
MDREVGACSTGPGREPCVALARPPTRKGAGRARLGAEPVIACPTQQGRAGGAKAVPDCGRWERRSGARCMGA